MIFTKIYILNDILFSSDGLSSELDNFFQVATTISYQSLGVYILDQGWSNSNYFINLNPAFDNLFGDKLLIRCLQQQPRLINYVTFAYYDRYDNILNDFNGRPLVYTSRPNKLGHFIESLPSETNYYYIKVFFNLQSNSGFDPSQLFFHCSQSISSTNGIIHGQPGIINYGVISDNNDPAYDSSDELSSELDNFFQVATTISYQSLGVYILDQGWSNSNYFINLNPAFDNLFGDKLLIRCLQQQPRLINYVTFTYYDRYDNILNDFNGRPLVYTSRPNKLGHFIESLPSETNYYYIKVFFNLQSNSGFDPSQLFFHCSQSTTSTSITTPVATSTTDSTIESTIYSTSESRTDSSIESTSDSTIESTTDSTPDSTTDPPIESPTHSTPESTADSTMESTAHSTIESTTHSTMEPTTDSTIESTADSTMESTIDSTIESTAHSTSESTIDSAIESTTHSTIESTADSTPEPTTGSTMESTTHSTSESTIDSAIESTTHSTMESTADSTPESITDSTMESTAQSTIESAADSTSESTTDSTMESTTYSTSESTAHSTIESTADSTPGSTTDSTMESTTDSTPESTAHSTIEFTADSTPESTTDLTIESTADSTIESTADSTPEPTTDSTMESTTHSTSESTAHSTSESTTDSTIESTAHSTIESTTDSTPDSTAHSTMKPTTDSTIESTAHSTSDSTTDLTPESTAHSTIESTTDSTAHSTMKSTTDSTIESTAHSTSDSTTDSTPESTAHSTIESTTDSTLDSTAHSMIESTAYSTMESTTDSTMESTTHSSTEHSSTDSSTDSSTPNGSWKFLRDIQAGDQIWIMSYDGTQVYLSEAMMIPHMEPNLTVLFYTVETMTGHRLSLSAQHYIRVQHFDYLPAKQLTANHSLYVFMKDGTIQSTRIRIINQEWKTGVYNLITLDGSLLVNGIAASSYVNNGFGPHHLNHRIFTPICLGYHLSKYFKFLQNAYSLNGHGKTWIVHTFLFYCNILVFIDQVFVPVLVIQLSCYSLTGATRFMTGKHEKSTVLTFFRYFEETAK
ncbi:unnamed protein product [Adineta steineri]|uniref:Hedgehog protein Hint domain-containing protein n=1 Tax=Adineta steineri TaxID=433720 RepID=A0A813Z5C5_9BILA|nr:unnamed protein product [Adineta steineri]